MRNKIILAIILVVAVAQLFQPNKTPLEAATENDFIAIEKPDSAIGFLLKSICYDCHSNQVNYPWYSEITPFSYIVQDHIDDGRKHLNFSEWGLYAQDKKEHKAEECWEEISEEEMPLPSYTFVHRSAVLNETQQAALVNYFKNLQINYKGDVIE